MFSATSQYMTMDRFDALRSIRSSKHASVVARKCPCTRGLCMNCFEDVALHFNVQVHRLFNTASGIFGHLGGNHGAQFLPLHHKATQ
jgi:hypothetical protein